MSLGFNNAIQQPAGLALNTDFLDDGPTELIMKGEWLSRDFSITLPDGTPVFRIDGESFSASHKKHVIDCRNGRELFLIKKEVWTTHWRCSAELPEGSGNVLFKTETHAKLFKGPTTLMTFQNAAQNGRQDELELKVHPMSREHEVFWNGHLVAQIVKETFKMRTEYRLTIVPRVDPVLIIVLATIMDDRMKTQQRSAAT